ncbi:MAG: SGNH/GDSL hydrolase family protein [Solirubrobacteraceae bacterium]
MRLVRRYVALGDSFTAGAPGELDPVRWPDEVAATLREGTADVEYYNLGEPSARTSEVAANQLDWCIRLAPDLVTVVCGANDVLLSVRPDIDAHAFALDRIFGMLCERQPEAIIVTATAPLVPEYIRLRPRSRRRVERGLAALNESTRTIAARHGVLCLHWGEHPAARKRENFAADGFHPSPMGVQRAALACVGELARAYGVPIAGLPA